MNDGQGQAQAQAQPLDPAVQIFQNIRNELANVLNALGAQKSQVFSVGLVAMQKTLENG